MSEPKDPERLLADALRAQAVFAPQVRDDAVPTKQLDPGTDIPAAYGLLSGTGADSLERAAQDLAPAPAPEPVPAPPTPSAPLPAYWILLLAVLLGLAAGSVVGLLTLV